MDDVRPDMCRRCFVFVVPPVVVSKGFEGGWFMVKMEVKVKVGGGCRTYEFLGVAVSVGGF